MTFQYTETADADDPEETVAWVRRVPTTGKYDTGKAGEISVNGPSGRTYNFREETIRIPIFAWSSDDIDFFREYDGFEVETEQ